MRKALILLIFSGLVFAGCSVANSKYAPLSWYVAHPVRDANLENQKVVILWMDGSKTTVPAEYVRVEVSETPIDGTYAVLLWAPAGATAIKVIVRTPEEKAEWDSRLRTVLAPRDVTLVKKYPPYVNR